MCHEFDNSSILVLATVLFYKRSGKSPQNMNQNILRSCNVARDCQDILLETTLEVGKLHNTGDKITKRDPRHITSGSSDKFLVWEEEMRRNYFKEVRDVEEEVSKLPRIVEER